MGGAKPPQRAPTARLRLYLLGTPRWAAPGGEPCPLAARDALLLLLLASEGPLARSRAAALLWPDSAPRQAGVSLRQRIFRLRRALGADVVSGDATIALTDEVQHDLSGLESGLRADPDIASGELLAGVHPADAEGELAAWLQAARERWRERRLRALADLAEEHAAAGRIAAALPYAERLVAEAPAAEHAHRRLMRLHYLRGDRAAALAAFRHCTLLLRRDLGVEPGSETMALARQIGDAAATPAPAMPLPPSLLRPPRLVGRQRAWAGLERGLAEGRPLRLVGEAGIGKSRLLEDFTRGRPGWLLAGARPGDAGVAYSLLSALLSGLVDRFGAPATPWAAAELARLAPALGPAAGDAFSPLRLRQALGQALQDWRAAGLAGIAVDDLQFADASSIELLLPLAAAVGPGWLWAHRPWPQCPAGLAEWAQVVPAPLSAGDVVDLVQSLALPGWPVAGADGWAGALAGCAGGNPMFVLRALAGWFAAGVVPDGDALAVLPDDLGTLLEQRLAQLTPLARGVARAAAAAGESFEIELAARLLGQPPLALADAIQELRAAQLMEGGAFVHDLVREAALRATPPELKRLLQRQVAEVLAERGAAPARIAAHWEAAGCWDEAAAAHAAAAAQAVAASALGEERAALEGQLRCLHAAGHVEARREAFGVELRRLRLLIRALDTEAAEAAAAPLLAQADGDGQRAAAYELLAHLRLERQDAAGALAAAAEARGLAVAAGEPRLALLAAQRQALALMRLGRAADAVAALQADAQALQPLDTDEQLHWLNDLALALDGADRRHEAIIALERVAALAAAAQRRVAEAETWSQLGVTLMYAGRLDDSSDAYRRSIALARQAGLDEASLLVDQMGLYGNLRDRGHYGTYLAHAVDLPAALRRAGLEFWAANAENDLATTYAMLGRADLALRTLAEPDPGQPALMRGLRLLVRANLARYYGVGRVSPERVAEWVDEAVRLVGEHGGRGYLRLRLALETAAGLPPDAGVVRVRGVLEEAQQRQMPMLAAAAGLQLLRLLLAAGCRDEAAEAARQVMARDLADGPQAGVFRPALGWLLYQALLDADPDRAGAVLAETAAWIVAIATEHVPPLFRDSFLQRQPVNAAVLAAARRAG